MILLLVASASYLYNAHGGSRGRLVGHNGRLVGHGGWPWRSTHMGHIAVLSTSATNIHHIHRNDIFSSAIFYGHSFVSKQPFSPSYSVVPVALVLVAWFLCFLHISLFSHGTATVIGNYGQCRTKSFHTLPAISRFYLFNHLSSTLSFHHATYSFDHHQ